MFWHVDGGPTVRVLRWNEWFRFIDIKVHIFLGVFLSPGPCVVVQNGIVQYGTVREVQCHSLPFYWV